MTRPAALRTAGARLVAGAAGVVLAVGVAAAAVAQADEYGPQQYNLERIGASSAWDVADGTGQVVAIIDSGVDLEHPDLVDRFVRDDDGQIVGRDFVDDDDDPGDLVGHGTMVAGIAAATRDNGVGIAGVAPGASLLPVRVLDADGTGTAEQVDAGIRWAVDNGATVINLSLESAIAGDGDGETPGVAAPVEAVEYADDHDVVVVAAAGNSGNPFTDYPASSPVVLVGATDQEDERAGFSDAGRDDLLMAPGVKIVSTWCRKDDNKRCTPRTHTYGIADGTSFAAPHVSGALAVLREMGLGPQEAVERLQDTARDIGARGRDDDTGYGLIDLLAAVGQGGPTDASTDPATPSDPPTEPATPNETTEQPPPTTTPTEPTTTPTTDPTAPSDPPGEVTTPPTDTNPTDTGTDPSSGDAAAGDQTAPLPVSDTGRDRRSGGWSVLAVLLTAVTGLLSGRAAVRER